MTLLQKSFAVLLLAFTFCASFAYSDAVFLQKPQNRTILDLKEPFFLNCSTDIASNDGMDWMVRIKGNRERICSSTKFYLTGGDTSCLLNYSMEVPNNRTLNLIVDPRIATLGDEYCCQFENGAGKNICSYLTIPPHPVSTAGPEFVDTTTVTHLNATTASQELPGNTRLIIGLTVAGILLIGLAIFLIFYIQRIRRARRQKKKKKNKNSQSEGKGEEERLDEHLNEEPKVSS